MTARVVLATALLLSMFPAGTAADIVHTRDGLTLEGKIVEETDQTLVIELVRSFGAVRMKFGKGEVTVVRGPSPQEEYRDRAAAVADKNLPGHLDLAQWCFKKSLKEQGDYHLVHVVTDGRGSREAQEAQRILLQHGYREYPDRGWLNERQFWESKGYQRWKDAWVTPEYLRADAEVDRLEAEMEQAGERARYEKMSQAEASAELARLQGQVGRLQREKVKRTAEAQLHEALSVASSIGSGATVVGPLGGTSTVTNPAATRAAEDEANKSRQADAAAAAADRQLGHAEGQIEYLTKRLARSGIAAEDWQDRQSELRRSLLKAELVRAKEKIRMKIALGRDGLPD